MHINLSIMSGKRKADTIEDKETGKEETTLLTSSSSSTTAKPKSTKGKLKKKAPNTSDNEASEASETEKVKEKPLTKKALAALEREEKRQHNLEKKKKLAKTIDKKPLSGEENLLSRNASMHRNRAIIAFMNTVKVGYEETREYIKVAAAKKAIASLEALSEPIVIPRKLLTLEGIGKSTVEKITKFLLEEYVPPGDDDAAEENEEENGEEEEEEQSTTTLTTTTGTTTTTTTAKTVAKNPDDEWIKDSDKEVIMGLIASGELSLDKVHLWRQDIDGTQG